MNVYIANAIKAVTNPKSATLTADTASIAAFKVAMEKQHAASSLYKNCDTIYHEAVKGTPPTATTRGMAQDVSAS